VSGLELRNQPAERGEALPDEFDGRVLNPDGVEIDLPYWVFKRRASDPGRQKSHSKDSGYSNPFLKTLGRDCSGLANPAVERTRAFESDLGHTRISDEYQRAQVDKIIAEIKAKRRVPR
jgi:hypothetical protein